MAKTAQSKVPQAEPKNFEDALGELERILADMEAGNTPLEESLVKYERGNYLIQYCRTILGSAEKQIELLSKDAAGQLVATPLDENLEAESS